MKLEPADVLVNINSGTDLWARLRRWAVGKYSHCFLYMGKWGKTPMLFESNGRGVVLQSLSNRYGQEVVVMRLKRVFDNKSVIDEAKKLASDPQAYYDYSCLIWHIVPRVIFEKLGLNPPLKYQRNFAMVCSECIAEVFWRSGIEILPKNVVPFPGDFVSSPLLDKVWEGSLSNDLV